MPLVKLRANEPSRTEKELVIETSERSEVFPVKGRGAFDHG